MRRLGRERVWLIVAGVVTVLDLFLRLGARLTRAGAPWAEGALLGVGAAAVLAAPAASPGAHSGRARRAVAAFFALGALRAISLAAGLPVARANLVALGALALGACGAAGRRWHRRRATGVAPPSRDHAA